MLSRALRVLPFLCLIAWAQDPAATARKALDLVLAEKYQDVQPLFTADLQKALPPESLTKLSGQFKAAGAVEKVNDAQVTKSGPNTIVVIPVKFANQNL